MAKDKISFFERLTGAINVDDYEDVEEDEVIHTQDVDKDQFSNTEEEFWNTSEEQQKTEEDTTEGQLAVDVYQTPTDIFIKAMIAGIRPEDLDISITREMVTIKGRRHDDQSVDNTNYYHRELYWGSFKRSILLPQEVEVDGSEAIEKQGLLTIRLPKVNKNFETKLKVKSSS